MLLPIMAAVAGWCNNDGKLQKQTTDEAARTAFALSQITRIESRLDSTRAEVRRLRLAARGRGGFAVVIDTVAVEAPRGPGIVHRSIGSLIGFLWGPFRGGRS